MQIVQGDDVNILRQFTKQTIPIATSQEDMFREDHLPEPVVLSQFLESGVDIELH